MKKHLSFLSMALFVLLLFLVPQQARAELDVAGNLTQPFTIEKVSTTERGYIRFYRALTWNSTVVTINLEYRIAVNGGDYGEWTTIAIAGTTTSTDMYNKSIDLPSGSSYKIQFRGINNGFSKSDTDYYTIALECYSTPATSLFKMSGNIMSLIKGYDTGNELAAQAMLAEADELPSAYCFYSLFTKKLTSNMWYVPTIDAENLIFPATKLTNSCYMNMFNECSSLVSSRYYGINKAPTFLSKDFKDKDGKTVSNAFRSLCLNCNALTSIHVNFTVNSYTNDNLSYWLQGTGSPNSTNYSNRAIYAPEIFRTYFASQQASSNSTFGTATWSTLPFSYPYITEVAPNASATANERITTNITKILYPLNPVTVNGITYTPVDMGYGVAWADRNIGASMPTSVGDYFMWGRTDSRTSNGVHYNIEHPTYANSLQPGSTLPADADAATCNIGSNWRMPTNEEWVALKENTAVSSNVFTSISDNTKTITLPAGGYYEQANNGANKQRSTYCYYWSSTCYSVSSSNGSSNAKLFHNDNNGGGWTQDNGYVYLGAPIRAIYDPSFLNPSFITHTLTINVGAYHYDFICQHGQTVTITAVPDYENCKVFRYWDDNHSNTTAERTFTVNDDATYTAVFWNDPDAVQYTATFYAADGETILDQDSYCEGQYIVYDGTTPVIAGYGFTGFSGFTAGTTQMGKTNVSFTAQYVPAFTVTATATNGTVTITPNVASDEVSPGVFKSGASVTLAVIPAAGNTFSKWNDGNIENPRTITVTADANYTATLAMESAPAAVDVYENVSANTTKILYDLSAKTGADGKTYIPIDLGYGVAWADRNVGAASTTSNGDYFRWSETIASTGYSDKTTTKSAGEQFSSTEDAATVNMGSNWHTPTNTEWQALIDNTTSDGITFTNKTDNDNSIQLPLAGSYFDSSLGSNGSIGYYWSSIYYQTSSDFDYWSYSYSYYYNAYIMTTHNNGTTYYATNWCTIGSGLSVRAIYQPSYTTYTLTINVGSYSYQYICQAGQSITVTANATTSGNVFDKWLLEDGSTPDNVDGTLATRTFVMTENITRTATFKQAPTATTYTVHFLAGTGSGTQMADQEFTYGTAQNLTSNTYTAPTATITYNYNGATGGNTTPSVTVNATFTGWSDGTNTYTDGQEVNNLTAEDGATINLTAQWEFDYDDCQVTIPTPEKAGYTFGGWQYEHEPGFVEDIEGGDTYYVSEDMTITANWTEVPAGTPHIDLYDAAAPKKDNVETDNATLLSSYPVGGTKSVDVTLHRKFTKDLWNTISLPFDFDTDGSVLNGKVFEMDKCTTSQDGMSISFLPVTWKEEKEAEMLAGQPYLVWTDTQIDEINFTGVQFKTFTAGTTLADPNGDVEFRAVFEDGYLTRKSSIFIGNGNHLYYAKQTDPGSRIRGYRGYFEIIKFNELEYTTPRVRIVINGEEVMSSEDNDTADIETRKYIEDGVLIIERGGVRYDAQGKRLE